MSLSPFATADLFDRRVDRPMSTASVKDMRRSSAIHGKVSESNRKVGVLAPQTFGERVAAFLRLQHPVKTAQQVEALSSAGGRPPISADTVSKWLEGASAPAGPFFLRLVQIYGAELVLFVDPDATPHSLRDAARSEREERLRRESARIQAEIDGLWSKP